MPRTLSHEEARRFYDRFGAKQDLQRLYEDPAIAVLLAHAGFEDASAVVEFGCGTGRLAERLLGERLGVHATYVGVDISETMVRLATTRLQRWGSRAQVHVVPGTPRVPLDDGAADRFLSTYVLDLLSEEDTRTMLSEAARVLTPTGRVCLASLTEGRGPASRLVAAAWKGLHALRPQLVGGCRPIRLAPFLGREWRVLHDSTVCTLGLCTEVLVAERARVGAT
jgi:ubiquinone/menaquinone biosynthesis C-methylase UbiE